MSNEQPEAIQVRGTLVTGDFILDQHIYEGGRQLYSDRTPGVLVKVEAGGAGKLADLLNELFQRSKSAELQAARDVVPARVPPADLTNGATAGTAVTSLEHQAYAFWRPRPDNEVREKQTWHCTEAMGFGALRPDERDSPAGDVSCEANAESKPSAEEACSSNDRAVGMPCACWPKPSNRPAKPEIVVIADGGIGFRESPECWQNLSLDTASHVILKTASDPTSSSLWEKLSHFSDKLTVIIAAAELRKLDARISIGLTWEETFRDFLRELDGSVPNNGRLNKLKNCRNLVVAFDSEAAIAVRMKKQGDLSGATVTFVYHASAIEEDTKNETPGTAFGLLTCFAAAVTLAIARNEDDLGQSLVSGLSAMQDLLRNGHGSAMETPNGFPVDRITKVILDPRNRFTRVTFPYSEVAAPQRWSFLGLAEPTATSKHDAAFEFARLTAIYGPVALANLPHLRIGEYLTVDGEEITSLRNLRQVLRRYDKCDEGKKPLSIGVFGPPGAGKSFAVKQIAQNLLGKRSDWLEFNLSQFEGPKDLIGAFHQIRDKVLQGKLPVAFFDEFDSRKYEWLQYLLAPMQDGRFQEGNLTHTIGKCIFIFAGGTSWTFDTFGPPEPLDPAVDPRTEEAHTQFRLAKGPDFQSRLDAYLNVVGPNPRVRKQQPATKTNGGGSPSADQSVAVTYRVGSRVLIEAEDDIWWPIRRALMLRSTLKLKLDAKLDIDSGLLHALLRVSRYRHGSRSMEKILFPVQAAARYRPSFVPHRSQLELHTRAQEFLDLLENHDLSKPLDPIQLTAAEKEAIAPRIHETWNELMVRSGDRKLCDSKSLDKEMQEYEEELKEFDLQEKKLHALATENPAEHQKAIDEGELSKIRGERKKFRSKITALLSNIGAAERMPGLLAIVGLCLARGRGAEASASDQPDSDHLGIRRRLEFHLELLASEEHRGWMEWYLSRGWTYHADDKRAEKQHRCLMPYSELKEPEKAKDRTAVQHFLDFLRETEFHIEPATMAAT